MKNKINHKVVFILLLLIFSGGCKKALQRTPNGRIGLKDILDKYIETKGLLSAAYSQLMPIQANLFFWQTLEVLTDNAFEARTSNGAAYVWNSGQLSVNRQVYASTGGGAAAGRDHWWNIFWKGVRLANIAIQEIPKSTAVSALEKKEWLAQARLLRAWYYFEILEYYGPFPFFDKPFDVNFAGWQKLKRPTYDELATRIAAECDTVIQWDVLPMAQWQQANKLTLLPTGFAYALKSRVLLYNASLQNNPEQDKRKWERAADAAKALIDLPDFSLVPISAYGNLFGNSRLNFPHGIIYRFPQNNATALHNTNGVPLESYGLVQCFKAGEVPTQELVDCFEMKNGALPVAYKDESHLNVIINPAAVDAGYSESDGGNPYQNRDARFYKDILFNGANYGVPTGKNIQVIIHAYVGGGQGIISDITQQTPFTTTGYYTRKGRNVKWYGTNSTGNGVGSSKVVFRIAEAYLNYAEAECELGNLEKAKWALNKIRTRAGQPKIENVPGFKNTQRFLRKRIRNERRVEFCFEGLRFFDQRRWKVLDKTNRLSTGMRITKIGNNEFRYKRINVYNKLSYTPKYMVMPIPQDEAKKIPSLLQPKAWR